MNHLLFNRQLPAILLFLLMGTTLHAQNPADNPVAGILPVRNDWTNRVRWSTVVNVGDVTGLIKTGNLVDSTVFAMTMQQLSAKGGVLYFPSGNYQFHFDVILPNRVVLRGADRRDSLSLTHFQFSKFNPAPKHSKETAVPKKITIAAGTTSTVGLVNLDINRAYVDFRTNTPRLTLTNVILYGLRINNAAAVSPTVPTAYQNAHNHQWQRWPNAQTGSINLKANRNFLIVRCRINDEPTDNYRQNGYLIDDGMSFDGTQAMFKFTDHVGLNLQTDRHRKNSRVSDNVIWVTAGNAAITDGFMPLADEKNQQAIIVEKKNVVSDGIHAPAMNYTLLYNNEALSEARQFSTTQGDTLAYRLIKPDAYDQTKRYPLILFLHDYEEIGTDNKAQLRQFVWQLAEAKNKEKYPCFIVAPQLPPTEKRWRSEAFSSNTWQLQANIGMLDELSSLYNIDPTRIYVIGINAGGEAAWDIAIRYPQRFAAVVPLAAFYRFSTHSARQLRSIPIWTFFGDSDEWFGKLTKQGMKSDLKAAGLDFRITELPNMGHKCWNVLVDEVPEFLPWLFARQKNTAP